MCSLPVDGCECVNGIEMGLRIYLSVSCFWGSQIKLGLFHLGMILCSGYWFCTQAVGACWQEKSCISLLNSPWSCYWFPGIISYCQSWFLELKLLLIFFNALFSSWMKLWLLHTWTNCVWSWQNWVRSRPNTWACQRMGPSSQTTTDTEQVAVLKDQSAGMQPSKALVCAGFLRTSPLPSSSQCCRTCALTNGASGPF